MDPNEQQHPALVTGNAVARADVMPNLPAVVPRCGAPTKAGTPCQSLGLAHDGRCAMHQPPPQTVEGLQVLPVADLDDLLATTAGRRSILAAVARSVAAGKCTTGTANALVTLVKVASEQAVEKLQKSLDQALTYAADLESQLGGVTARGRR